MRTQQFGIEIEMTGITRSTAARVIAGYFNTTATHVGGTYDAYTVRDNDDRQWKVVSDSSLTCTDRNGRSAGRLYAVEFVSPICHYEDIETIQELVRKLRAAGARVMRYSCSYQRRTAYGKDASQHRQHHGIERRFAVQDIAGQC